MKKFVKIIALVTIFLSICTMLFGCGDNATTEVVQETEPETLAMENTEPEYGFAEVPSEGNEIEAYREEYKNRIETNTFKREDELTFLENNGFFIYTGGGHFELSYLNVYGGQEIYSYPIVYQSDNGVEVWRIDEYGRLYAKSVIGSTSKNRVYECYGLIHYTAQEGEKVIESNEFRAISYEPETGKVKRWEYGELIGQAEVPKNSVYVGSNHCEGYMFKNGTDVWSVENAYEDEAMAFATAKIIAHKVKFFITARYQVNSGEYQPLFLMTDGSLKTYRIYNGNSDAPADDECHLMDAKYEGGYDVTELMSIFNGE